MMNIKHPLVTRIDLLHESKIDKPRPHIGPSQLGDPCDKAIWLTFRWVNQQTFPGRIKRLFRRGQNEEAVIVQDLRDAGLEVIDTGYNQRRIDFGPHVSGRIDGIITKGVPEAPSKPHTLEIKTHNKKCFDDLDKNGVQKSKPDHYTQMQCYMYGAKIDRALYVAVCKDDDRLYIERVKLNPAVAIQAIDRALQIARANTPPPGISTNPTWYQCKFCSHHTFCHKTKLAENINCRTCAHSTANGEGLWTCELWTSEIPLDIQHKGCESHVMHPELVPWPLDQDKSTESSAAYTIDGDTVINGQDGITTQALLAGKGARLVAEVFEGKVL